MGGPFGPECREVKRRQRSADQTRHHHGGREGRLGGDAVSTIAPMAAAGWNTIEFSESTVVRWLASTSRWSRVECIGFTRRGSGSTPGTR